MNVEARAVRVERGGGGGSGAGGGAAVFVSVTDDAGKPIVDLAAGQLLVRAIGAGGGGAPLDVAVGEVASRGEGLYVAAIAPGAGSAWPPGEHVLAVVVRRAFDRGQSLAVLTIP